ncbi:hypothetical protein ACTFIY_010598 [Dictyostelium cf. discoideum]
MISKHHLKELFDSKDFGIENISFQGYLPEFFKKNYAIELSNKVLPLLSNIKFDYKNKGSQGLNVFFKSQDILFQFKYKESIIEIDILVAIIVMLKDFIIVMVGTIKQGTKYCGVCYILKLQSSSTYEPISECCEAITEF